MDLTSLQTFETGGSTPKSLCLEGHLKGLEATNHSDLRSQARRPSWNLPYTFLHPTKKKEFFSENGVELETQLWVAPGPRLSWCAGVPSRQRRAWLELREGRRTGLEGGLFSRTRGGRSDGGCTAITSSSFQTRLGGPAPPPSSRLRPTCCGPVSVLAAAPPRYVLPGFLERGRASQSCLL